MLIFSAYSAKVALDTHCSYIYRPSLLMTLNVRVSRSKPVANADNKVTIGVVFIADTIALIVEFYGSVAHGINVFLRDKTSHSETTSKVEMEFESDASPENNAISFLITITDALAP